MTSKSNLRDSANTGSVNEHEEDDITLEELLGWLEFGSWTTLALAPMLYYVNGPAVSTDQFVVRTILVVTAAITAVSLRGYKLWCGRKSRTEEASSSSGVTGDPP